MKGAQKVKTASVDGENGGGGPSKRAVIEKRPRSRTAQGEFGKQ